MYDGLPFPRGKTYGDGVLTMTASLASALEGRLFRVPDDVNGTGFDVVLRCVRNKTGGDITVARTFAQFAVAAAGEWGRKIAVYGSGCTADLPSCAIDDAYPVGLVIVEHDLFWVVDEGPIEVKTGNTSVNLANGVPVSCDTDGDIAAATTTAGNAIVGYIDLATTEEDDATLMHARPYVSQRSDAAG